MRKQMNMPDREWSKNMWARIAALIDGQGQAIAGAIKAITFNGGNVPPDATGRVTMTEIDPTVPAWAKATSKPTYTAQEVGALPSSTAIPAKTSDLTNDGDGDSPFATLDDIPSTSAPDVSQATGVLSLAHGGTGYDTADGARHHLKAAGGLWYSTAYALDIDTLFSSLISDVSGETIPQTIHMEREVMFMLTAHKCSRRFVGVIKYVSDAQSSSGTYPFAYHGMTFNGSYFVFIYGMSWFSTEGGVTTVTASVYEVTGTAL